MKRNLLSKSVHPMGLAGLLCLCGLAGNAGAMTFTVNSNADSGVGSLRTAITNANITPGDDIIEFQIGVGGVETINLLSSLPTITETVFIDGWSQGGMGYTGTPLIEIDGTGTNNIAGLQFSGANCANSVARGLSIGDLPATVLSYGITVNDAPEVWIYGCHIGLDASGTVLKPIFRVGVLSTGSGTTGLLIGSNADGVDDDFERNIISGCDLAGVVVQTNSDPTIAGNYLGTDITGSIAMGGQGRGVQINSNPTCTIGGPLAAQRNVISGNSQGIAIFTCPSSSIKIQNNYIGLRASGTTAVSNTSDGIYMTGSSGVVIGTDGNGISDATEGNVISCNTLFGIRLETNSQAQIMGNRIGTSAAGSTGLAAQQRGIQLTGSAVSRIGGTGTNQGNLISGNTNYGIFLQSCTATDLEIQGNCIGLAADGATPMGNGVSGILLNTSSGVVVGTDADGSNDAAERNVISCNTSMGVDIQNNSNSIVAGNYIGTTATGNTGLGAQTYGIRLLNNPIGQIGGSLPAQRNVISGNSTFGVLVSGFAATDLSISGNYIGVGADGVTKVSNASAGIELSTATGVLIGTDADGSNDANERNVISGNGASGIYLLNSSQAQVFGNYIGTDATGLVAIGSQTAGVRIQNSPVSTIGGPLAAQRNIVSGNSDTGLYVQSTTGTDLKFQNNYIGLGVDGTTNVSNAIHGIQLNAATGVLIGTNADGTTDTAERNVIAGNGTRGIYLRVGSSATIAGNYIGTNATGMAGVLNQTYGVLVDNSPVCHIGGSLPAQRNIISGNSLDGVHIVNTTGTDLVVAGNYIGLGQDGTTHVANSSTGVTLNVSTGVRIGTDADGSNDVQERNVVAGNAFAGIYILNNSSANVMGNYVGTTATGMTGIGNQTVGVRIHNSPTSTVGGPLAAQRNIISGNSDTGVYVFSTTGTNLKVQNNYIGLGQDGSTVVTNTAHGIQLNASTGVLIGTDGNGTTDTEERNVIAGNGTRGIYLRVGSGATIAGNYIGTDATGMVGKLGQTYGVQLSNSPVCHIGGSLPAQRNIISGNSLDAVHIASTPATDVVVAGNIIGLGPDGSTAVSNTSAGVVLNNSSGVLIGTNADGSNDSQERNVISSNPFAGVYFFNNASGTVAGNYLGTDSTGTIGKYNQGSGFRIDNGTIAQVGGPLPAQRNIISGNSTFGVLAFNSAATDIDIQNNLIGTDSTGLASVANGNYGVLMQNCTNINLGGPNPNEGNVISGNSTLGVYLYGNSNNNVLRGNMIGTGVDGVTPVENLLDGITIDNSSASNIIGGIIPGEGNTIAHNGRAAIILYDDAGDGNLIVGNSIYDNAQLGIDLHEFGPSVNDDMDSDSGPNEGSNFPVITQVYPGESVVIGYIKGLPTSAIAIDLYKSPTGNLEGRGEGKIYLGQTVANTDATGYAPFSIACPPAANGEFYSVTATDAANNTSEFSPSFEAKDPATVSSVNLLTASPSNASVVDYEVNFSDAVTGVDPVDFTVTGGLSGSSVQEVVNPLDKCLSLDGNGEFGDAPDAVYFSGDFTVEAWVYPRQSENYPRIIDFGNGPASDNVYLLTGYGIDGTPTVGYNIGGSTAGAAVSPDPIPVDRWSHIAGTLQGTTLTLYVNGQPVATDTVAAPPTNIIRTANYIGASSWGSIQDPDSNMKFDELRIWSVARSQAEIQASMDSENLMTLPQAGLVSYYRFDAAQDLGVAADSLVDDFEDLSGNGLHADMVSVNPPTLESTDIPRDHYVVKVNTGSGDGTLGLNFVDNDSVKDLTPNPVGGNGNQDMNGPTIVIDKTVPVSSASGETTQAGDIVEVASASDDGAGTGVANLKLYVKTPIALSFNDTGLTPGVGGEFQYTATMDGPHQFATVATDGAGNAEPVPTIADLTALVNVVPNSDYQSFVGSPSTYLFPMTDDIDISIDFTTVTGSGLVTVSRSIVTSTVPPGYDPARMIDESLSITSAPGITNLAANLTWNFDPTSDDGLTGVVENVYQFEAGSLVNTYPVTPSGNSLFIPAITSFSDWFAGNDVTAVGDWQVLDAE